MREKMKIILGGGLEGLRETDIRKEWTRSRGDMAYVYVIFFRWCCCSNNVPKNLAHMTSLFVLLLLKKIRHLYYTCWFLEKLARYRC